METNFCWRCKTDVPFLNEVEWSKIDHLISDQVKIIKKYREEHGSDLKSASENAFKPATEKYFELTGFLETNYLAILHHRRSLYGPKCNFCSNFLRTSKATFCASCGKSVVTS